MIFGIIKSYLLSTLLDINDILSREIHKKQSKPGLPAQTAIFCHFFVNISSYGYRIIFLLATLWLWVQAGHFAYKKPNIYDNFIFEFYMKKPKIVKISNENSYEQKHFSQLISIRFHSTMPKDIPKYRAVNPEDTW